MNRLHQLIMKIWSEETIPDEWNTGVICPILKKGDKLDCNNYRGITLLSVVYKTLTTVIRNRLDPHVEAIVGEYQCGFRRNRSTSDQIFSIRQMMEKLWEHGIDLHHLFIDFKQAYDSVDRQTLWRAMVTMGIPPKYVRMVRASITNSRGCVCVQNTMSRAFGISCGLRQGDGLSPVIFNLALEWTLRNARINTTGTIANRTVQILAYADDIDIASRDRRELDRCFNDLQQSAQQIGLHVNEGKTKYLKMSRRTTDEQSITIGQQTFERVTSFDYLGSRIAESGSISEEIQKRITIGNKGMFGLMRIFRSKELRRRTKIEVYKWLLRPAVLYGSEAWTLSQTDEQKLARFERKVLRNIFGPIQDQNGTWRHRYNHELSALFGEPNITAVARANRLRWAGHVARMNESRVAQRLMNARLYTERRRGRPRTRWTEDVETDAAKIGVRNWRTAAQDREGWRRIIEEAIAHLGL